MEPRQSNTETEDSGITLPVPVREFKRTDPRTGKVTTVHSFQRRERGTASDEDWLKGKSVRTIGHLLTGFRAEVKEAAGTEVLSRQLLNAWWTGVEETEWQELRENLQWLETFITPLHDFFGHGRGRPPMVRRIERERAKQQASEPVPSSPSSAFKRYHLMRPDVYIRFKQAAEEKLVQGCTTYSAIKLLQELRAAGLSHAGVDFGADYARKLIAEDERFASFFHLMPRRKQP